MPRDTRPETRRTIYNQAGFRAEYIDNEAVSPYCENTHRITMTRDEWQQINAALEDMKNDE